MTSLAAVENSIGQPEEIVNHFVQKMSLKEGRGSNSIEVLTLALFFVQCEIIVSTDGNYHNCARMSKVDGAGLTFNHDGHCVS